MVRCPRCHASMDPVDAAWCRCLVTERSLVCADCGHCICDAPPRVKQSFWRDAPRALWDRKLAERRRYDDAEPSEPAPTPGDALSRPLVLIVEDEPMIRRAALEVVTRCGCGAITAADGEEGLRLARRHRPDLVLTDALLPKLDGRELCLSLKQDPACAATRVVVMTALYTGPRYENEAFRRYRVDGYLRKPIHPADLEAVLLEHLVRPRVSEQEAMPA